MKKRITIVAITMIICVFLLTGCGSLEDKFRKVISDWRDTVLHGANDGYSVLIISGYRETNFSLDGISGEKTDYTVITVTPKISVAAVKVSGTLDGEQFELNANRHPLGNSYSVEINRRLRATTLPLHINDLQLDTNSLISEDAISGNDAMQIASAHLSYATANEVYVRLIENPITGYDSYFWYVAALENGTTKAVLIDILTGEILATR